MLFSAVVVGAVARGFGVSVEGAIVMGGMLALSSTAIVVRLLIEQLEHNAHHGRAAFGM